MTSKRWKRVEEIYDAALELDKEKRAAFLESSCADDRDLRREVESLLSHQEKAGDFLESPAMDVVSVPATGNESVALAPGTRLGPYVTVDLLGAGGMGEVYRATDTRLDRTVAIKVLPEHLARDPNRRERFEREARAVSSLNHPHICTLFDVGEQDGIHYIVMERVEGATLAARLEKGRLPLDQALEYAIQIADALDKAHRQGVVHRDLKPANIMITKSGTKLLDFGLARLGVGAPTTPLSEIATRETEPLTTEGAIIGTLQYMAPEQLEGKETDARSDIFSFGALVYEMVTGKRAFVGEGQASLIGAILKDDPGPMAEFQTVTPASLDHVIGRCLVKDPDQRWQTAADLMHELTWVGEAEPAALRKPESESRPRLFGVALATMAAGALITAVALGGFGPVPAGEVIRLTLPLDEGVYLDAGNPDLAETVGRPIWRAFELSPDGENLVYVGYREGQDAQLYLQPLDQGQANPIPGTEGVRVLAGFSPDGQSIRFTNASEELMWVLLDGGEVHTISTTGPEFVRDAGYGWADDGKILLTSPTGVLQVAASGGAVNNLTTRALAPGYVQGYPQSLPGGAVLYAEGPPARGVPSEEFDVIVELLETGDRFTVVEGGTDPTYIDSGHIVFVRSGKMMAVTFDAAGLKVTGEPVMVLEDVMQTEGVGNLGGAAGIGQYSISDSGTLAYLPGGLMPLQATQLNWVDLAGNAEAFATSPRANGSQLPTRYSHARFSPDGTRLAYTEETDRIVSSTRVYDMNLGNSAAPLPKPFGNLEHVNGSFAWSPDGTEIVFAARLGGGPMNLYRTAADGSGEPARLTQSELDQEPWSWSPDGVVAFVESGDIMILAMDGENEPRPFLETFFEESHPTFSPDGNLLAYTSDKTGRKEIHVRPFPGLDPPTQISSDGGQSPTWSADGQQLFFRYPATDRIMVVDIPGGSILARGSPRDLFEIQGGSVDGFYDVSPDGERFVMGTRVVQQTEPVTRINIILNWIEELKERVPVP